MKINCTSIRAYSQRAVIVQPGYNLFLMSIFVDGKTVHGSYLIKTYLVDNSDRDRSESPGKSTVGDRNDES